MTTPDSLNDGGEPSKQRLRPFVPDPEVMARIRAMQYRDAERVAELHEAAMGQSLWARLGRRFLVEVYRGLIDDPRFLGFVYEEDGRVRGFVAGTTDGSAMMSDVFRSRVFGLGLALVPGLLRDPLAVRPLLETAFYFDRSGSSVSAESLFCSFERDLRGKRVSGHINKVLFDELLSRGYSHVKVTTETDNEGANRQLRSWGFVDDGQFRFYSKQMVRYVLDLEACERVDPVSRHPTV